MKRSSARGVVTPLALVLILAGCGGADSATLGPTPSPSPTPRITPAPPTPGPAATVLTGARSTLAAGRYAGQGFVPRVTVQVAATWRAAEVSDGFLAFEQGTAPNVVAVQIARPDAVYRSSTELLAPSSAEAAASAMQSNGGLHVDESSSATFDGRPATVVLASAATTAVKVLHIPRGAYALGPGMRLWAAFVDTPEGVLAVLVTGPAASWQPDLAAAQPLLDSLTIE